MQSSLVVTMSVFALTQGAPTSGSNATDIRPRSNVSPSPTRVRDGHPTTLTYQARDPKLRPHQLPGLQRGPRSRGDLLSRQPRHPYRRCLFLQPSLMLLWHRHLALQRLAWLDLDKR